MTDIEMFYVDMWQYLKCDNYINASYILLQLNKVSIELLSSHMFYEYGNCLLLMAMINSLMTERVIV